MELKTINYYVGDSGDASYHLFYNYDKSHMRGYITDAEILQIADAFLRGERSSIRNRRFIVAVPSINKKANQILLGFEVINPPRMNLMFGDKDPIRVMHFNYYPGRKGMVLTHEATYANASFVAVEEDEEFIKAFRHTYKSLAHLGGGIDLCETTMARLL